MIRVFETLIFVILSIFAFGKCANVDYDGIAQISLYHDLSGKSIPEYTERGNITITSLRVGSTNVQNTVLAPEDQLKLKKLGADDQIYRLKAVVQNFDGSVSDLYTFVKACMLVESNLADAITISLDYSGLIFGVSEAIPYGRSCGETNSNNDLQKFKTNVYVQHTETGPIPDTASYIQKLDREREARERGETKDNRSFLAKYWMYIIPVVVFMIISSAANPEGAAGGSAGGGGR